MTKPLKSQSKLANLAKQLDYHFTDDALLTLALTHRSTSKGHNYERLEFLGDAILSFVMAEHLYVMFASQQEGKLTRMRSTLVRQESLVKVAQSLQLGQYLILGTGEIKAGGRERASILADVVEALIGAIYLDSQDMTLTKKLVLSWFLPMINQTTQTPQLKDPKSQLQEWLQAKKLALPSYQLQEVRGKAPDEVFVVTCQVTYQKNNKPQLITLQDVGKSRRIAEQNAAKAMLEKISQLSG